MNLEQLKKQIEGQKATMRNLRTEKAKLQKEIHDLRQDLGLLDETGYVEDPSLPLIKVGAGLHGRPVCEKHGAMLRYKHDIWRCEACKTAVDLSDLLRFIREEFDGVVVIK